MRIGCIARADDRGIGIQTWEFVRNMPDVSVLVVREPGAERKGFLPDFDRYPGAPTVTWDPRTGVLPMDEVEAWLSDLDVVYMVETPYDFRVFTVAARLGVATIVHANPEFWRWDDPTLPRPTVWWLPTTWRTKFLPDEAVVVPVPVPEPPRPIERTAGFTALHVAGHRAAGDRNGTTAVFQAIRQIRSEMTVRIECQDPRLPAVRSTRNVTVERNLGGRPDRWDLYGGADVLVLPRRYGGLCLPVLEAIAAGIVPVLTDVSPNRDWPAVLVETRRRGTIRTPGGEIRLALAEPRDIARTLDRLNDDEEALLAARTAVDEWRRRNDWAALSDAYTAALAEAVDRARSRARR